MGVIISYIIFSHFAYIYSKLLMSDLLSQLPVNYTWRIISNPIEIGEINQLNFGGVTKLVDIDSNDGNHMNQSNVEI